jgi:NTE family protein
MTTPWRRGGTERRPTEPRRRTRSNAPSRLVAMLIAALLTSAPAQAPLAGAPLAGAPLAGVPAATQHGRVALILSGGAARGAAHVGVIRTLVDAGVPIDFIVGTSMGSLIGGLYAAGFDARTLADVVEAVDPSGAGELLLPPRGGFLDATPLAMMVDALTGGMPLAATPITFFPMVTDILTNEPSIAPMASLGTAIQASTAIPVLFAPIEHEGTYYYDGAIWLPIPVALARELGAAYVITSTADRDVPYAPGDVQANFSRLYVSLLRAVTAESKLGSDVTLDPLLLKDSYMDFGRSADFVLAGEGVARAALPTILADLAALGIPLRTSGDRNAGDPINEGWRERLAAARRDVVMRDRPWNLGFDLAFSPAASERVTPAPAPIGSRLRFGVDLRDGFLGRGSLGASFARSVTGGDDALVLRAGYRFSADWSTSGRIDIGLGDGAWVARTGVAWSPATALELGLALRLPDATLELNAAWAAPGIALAGQVALAPGAGWWRGHLDARAAAAPGGPDPSPWTVRGRALLGTASPATPEGERFSVGPAVGLRGTPPDAWIARSVAVASLEVARTLGATAEVLDAALLTPSAWVFVDVAAFDDAGVARGTWALGIGAGIEGALFGIVPLGVGVDLAYGVGSRTWALGWRLGRSSPVTWRW